MNLATIFHRPMSEYAFAVDENKYIFRLRTGLGEVTNVSFGYADRAAMTPELEFKVVSMDKVRSDSLYDWYEVCVETEFIRIAYYFEITDGNKTVYYLGDIFEKDLNVGRADYFQLPFNHRADRITVPEWVKNAVVYNIFPDSFATDYRSISGKASSSEINGIKVESLLGGTINGITKNLDYIKELGFNCVYLNPVFVANNYHKYDLIDYYHIDPTRGTDDDFAKLVETAHAMDMRVIIDGVFNHTSSDHPFFVDIKKKGKESKYYDYYYDLGDGKVEMPSNGEIPSYTCFAYVPQMPKTNTANDGMCEYFCNVGEYWVNKFNVDGWRLDVANELDDQFLRKFKERVTNAKKDAIVIGEVWENANHYVCGNMMDGAMNYDFRRFVLAFIAKGTIDAKEFDLRVSDLLLRYPKQSLYTQLNLLDSHDVSRFFFECGENRDKMELAILLQMTFIGMPCVFYGDESELSGNTEPLYRQAMKFDDKFELYDIYKKMIKLRKDNPSLTESVYETLNASGKLYSIRRGNIDITINAGEEDVEAVMNDDKIILKKNFENNILGKYGYVVTIN